jgi:hypothetical protein
VSQPCFVTVRVRFTPVGIPVTAPAPRTPILGITVVPASAVKLTLYVAAPFGSQTGPLIVIGELAHGILQFTGTVTFTLLTQLPLVAVTVIFVPMGIFIIVFPIIFPELHVTIPILLVKDIVQNPVL